VNGALGTAAAAKRADPGRTPVHELLCRRGDHSEQRLALRRQRDIDGEFAVALDEFAGAVERINHP
jgi:adenylosuccinate lyase